MFLEEKIIPEVSSSDLNHGGNCCWMLLMPLKKKAIASL